VIEEPEEPRRVYLIAGGTPAARQLALALDDPEVRARLEEGVRQLAEAIGATVEAAARALAEAIEAYRPLVESTYATLRDAGVLPEVPPEDPRERALWLRQHRGTGPDRQVQHARRPRRIA
jgi:hypothetical protein